MTKPKQTSSMGSHSGERVIPNTAADVNVHASIADDGATWNKRWSLGRRLLEARKALRGTKLWEQFELQRSYDAFSIHVLARGFEEVMTEVGVISSFHMSSWQKNGNVTIIEGFIRLSNVDNLAEYMDVPALGEGVDNSDKGSGKALSYARKAGMVSALNLGIGVDNEASNEQAQPEEARTVSKQKAPQAAPRKANGSNGTSPASGGKTYTIKQVGVADQQVDASVIVQTCWPMVFNSPTVTSLMDWCHNNEATLKAFAADFPAKGAELRQLVEARRETLAEKGAL